MTTKYQSEDLLAIIEDAGYRLTDTRRSIISFLDQQAGSCSNVCSPLHERHGFSAEEINEELTLVGRATVYRTLKLLVDEGVLCKLFSQDGSPKYAVSQFGHHHHTLCVKCGSVGEFRDATVERLMKSIEEGTEGSIVGHRFELYEICPSCRPS